MPIWEIEEIREMLLKCHQRELTKEEIETIKCWGGIPRLLFPNEEIKRFKRGLQNMITNPSLGKISNRLIYLINDQKITDDGKFHYNFIYKSRIEKVSTKWVRSEWMNGLAEANQDWLKLIDATKVPRDFFRRIFEHSYLNDLTTRGNNCISYKSLDSSSISQVIQLNIPKLERKNFDDIIEFEFDDFPTLWVPNSTNYPGIDAIICFDRCIYLLQVTVGEKYPICKTLSKILDVMLSKLDKDIVISFIFFVIFDDSFNKFTLPVIPKKWKLSQFVGKDILISENHALLFKKLSSSLEEIKTYLDNEDLVSESRDIKKQKLNELIN